MYLVDIIGVILLIATGLYGFYITSFISILYDFVKAIEKSLLTLA